MWPFKKKVQPVAFDCPSCEHRTVCGFKDAFERIKQTCAQMEQESQSEKKNIFGISVVCKQCK